MALNKKQHNEIKQYLVQKIRQKLEIYDPETNSMPFHYRLLGKNRMALFSFVHSVNTMLGQSIFEHVGKIIAEKDEKEGLLCCEIDLNYVEQIRNQLPLLKHRLK